VQKRGAEVIAARGKSSAASAASACLDLVKNLNYGKGNEVFSTAVLTNGEWYNLPKGLVFSLPVKAKGQGSYEVVENFKLSSFAKEKISLTCKELEEEKKVISSLL
jgi:malate/lactate dehydrogenase